MSLDITVHHFNVDSSSPPSIRLLEDARRLVDSATATSCEWRSVTLMRPTNDSLSSTAPLGPCFVWGRTPPVIDRSLNTAQRQQELYDWDAPREDDMEIIDIISLLEFEEMDLRDIFLHPKSRFTKGTPRSNSPSYSRPHIATVVNTNYSPQPTTQFSFKKDFISYSSAVISISKLIPFPHYYESLDPARPPPPRINSIPAFRIARSLTPSATLTTPFARTAWLVPLRGVPPVEGASPAQLVNTPSCEPLLGDLPRTIQWTPAAVSQFWTFLLQQRNMNNFGPLALAYMISPNTTHNRQRCERRNNKLREADTHREGEEKQTGKRKRPSIPDEDYREPERVSAWEYIKIYHDSQYAMKLRSLLDSFRWQDNADRGNTVDDIPPTQYRVLKATRLVLVDETGDAVLLA